MTMPPPSQHRWFQVGLRTLFAVATVVAVTFVAGPIGVLVLLFLAFFASLWFSSKRLPLVVTTLQGQRLSRQVYMTAMVFVGLWGPLFPAGLILVCMPKELTATLVTYVAWAACTLLAIVMAVHWKTVTINPQVVAQS
jgi:hypothetical protein